MAKSLGGGFPIGAFWVRAPYADLLGAGTHGTHLRRLAAGLRGRVEEFCEVIERDGLAANARAVGSFLLAELTRLAEKYPSVVRQVRGLGLMIGLELAEKIPAFAASDKAAAIQFVNALHQAGLLAIPAGTKSSACCRR